jgi:3-oxoacyl-[acyl-carrier-protein] synthase-1
VRRVFVTGLGVVSSIGNNAAEVVHALRHDRSGLVYWPPMAELGFRCAVYAPVKGWTPGLIPRRALQTTSPGAQYAMGATLEALADAGLRPEAIRDDPLGRIGAIIGSAFGGLSEATRTEQLLATGKSSRAGGTGVVKIMNSTASGNVAAHLGVRGRAYSVSSAFATGADDIGHGYELIAFGIQDACICGASEEAVWSNGAISFETARALPTDYNDRPAAACRPYDRDRQGLVLSEGAGIVVLESLERAEGRGATPIAEVIGYGAANDGADMFRPTGDGLRLAIRAALAGAAARGVETIDYVNAHGTGTPVGDPVEAAVMRDLFGEGAWVSSTKGLTGHGLGAAGAQEAVYTLLMLRHGFVAPTANLEHVDPECGGLRHVLSGRDEPIDTALSFSSGFGGTNACLVFRRCPDGPGAYEP